MKVVRLGGLGALLSLMGACGSESAGVSCRTSSECPVGHRCVDGICSRTMDGAAVDAAADGSFPDVGPDSPMRDASGPGPVDSGPVDSGPVDSGPVDSGSSDSGSSDSGSSDTGLSDASPCPSGVLCASTCIDPQTDRMNCGASADCIGANAGAACAMSEGCVRGRCELRTKRVFATSLVYTGNLGNLAGADAKCQSRANAASLGGSYRAWLASATSGPGDRFARSTIPYALVDGTVIANNWADLVDGALAAPINLTESGGVPPASSGSDCTNDGTSTWSSVRADGTPQGGVLHCAEWTTTAAGNYGWTGLGSGTGGAWSSACALKSCDGLGRLYCFEQ